MRKGQIKRVGNCWLLRYYEPVMENGRAVKRQKTTKLAVAPDTKERMEKAARAAADLILAPINARTAPAESRQDLDTFLSTSTCLYVKESKRPSTYASYLLMFRLAKPHLNGLQLREARTSDKARRDIAEFVTGR